MIIHVYLSKRAQATKLDYCVLFIVNNKYVICDKINSITTKKLARPEGVY